jgi:hypothetical protein
MIHLRGFAPSGAENERIWRHCTLLLPLFSLPRTERAVTTKNQRGQEPMSESSDSSFDRNGVVFKMVDMPTPVPVITGFLMHVVRRFLFIKASVPWIPPQDWFDADGKLLTERTGLTLDGKIPKDVFFVPSEQESGKSAGR